MSDNPITEISRLLADSNRVLFITGAGVSADSGLPTYRGVGGLYNRELTAEGYSIEECLSGSMFRQRPELTWKHMLQLGISIAQHGPNDAHRILAKWERQFEEKGGKVVIVTQNIDGYHRAAGSKNVYEFHGSLGTFYCTDCSWTREITLDEKTVHKLEEMLGTLPPRCPDCDAVIRPDVVLFVEMLPLKVIEAFQDEFTHPGFDMVFSIGTSAMFPYITAPVQMASRLGIPTVIINPDQDTHSASVQYHVPMRAAEALREIDNIIQIK